MMFVFLDTAGILYFSPGLTLRIIELLSNSGVVGSRRAETPER